MPKTHLQLTKLIDLFNKFMIRKIKAADHYERAYKYIFRLNMDNRFLVPEIFGQDGSRCDICYQPMKSKERHQVVHLDLISDTITKRSHLNMCENIITKSGCCPVGCGYRSSQIELRQHMIIYHSKLELKKWCINRDYLMY